MASLRPHNFYLDSNRLSRETDRRLHAADAENAGVAVQVPPRVASELARGVIVGAWHESREIADKSEAAAQRVGDASRILDARKDKWWADLWSEYDGLYRVRALDQEQKAKAGRLLEEDGMDRKAFPGWEEGSFDEHNDAVIVAEVLALGGKLFITSDTRSIDHALLNGWTERNRNRFGLTVGLVACEVDETYYGWANAAHGEDVMMRACIAAYWPGTAQADFEEVKESTEQGISALGRGHLPKFAGRMSVALERKDNVVRQVHEVRKNLPARMLAAERKRPRMKEARERSREQDRQTAHRPDIRSRWE